jgi:hypothetical protein
MCTVLLPPGVNPNADNKYICIGYLDYNLEAISADDYRNLLFLFLGKK